MGIQDHIGLFLALLLAGLMVLETRRYLSIRREDGAGSYPRHRWTLRLVSFLLLELAIVSYLLTLREAFQTPARQIASLGMSLAFALLAMIPLLRDWREVRGQMSQEGEELTRFATEEFRRALEEELRNRPPNQRRDESQK